MVPVVGCDAQIRKHCSTLLVSSFPEFQTGFRSSPGTLFVYIYRELGTFGMPSMWSNTELQPFPQPNSMNSRNHIGLCPFYSHNCCSHKIPTSWEPSSGPMNPQVLAQKLSNLWTNICHGLLERKHQNIFWPFSFLTADSLCKASKQGQHAKSECMTVLQQFSPQTVG